MFLNKHYVVPFVKECVARFPLPYLVNPATGYIALQMTTYIALEVMPIPIASRLYVCAFSLAN